MPYQVIKVIRLSLIPMGLLSTWAGKQQSKHPPNQHTYSSLYHLVTASIVIFLTKKHLYKESQDHVVCSTCNAQHQQIEAPKHRERGIVVFWGNAKHHDGLLVAIKS